MTGYISQNVVALAPADRHDVYIPVAVDSIFGKTNIMMRTKNQTVPSLFKNFFMASISSGDASCSVTI